MSLSTLLDQPDVRERFNAEFVKPKIALARTTYVAPNNSKRSWLVGTAFDYILRLHVTSINDDRRVWSGPWVAESAVKRLARALALGRPVFAPGVERSTRDLLTRARGIAEGARGEFVDCASTGRVSDKMLRNALLLGQLDSYFRRRLLPADFGHFNEADVVEVRALLRVARGLSASPFLASRVCVLNPTFGEASALVRGADADLLIDDTLIELKTTKELEFSAETFRQLMGYYILSKIGGLPKGIRPKPEIRNIAMYSSRHGVFAKVPVDSVVNAKTFVGFVRWFVQRAKYGPTWRPTTIVCEDGVRVTF